MSPSLLQLTLDGARQGTLAEFDGAGEPKPLESLTPDATCSVCGLEFHRQSLADNHLLEHHEAEVEAQWAEKRRRNRASRNGNGSALEAPTPDEEERDPLTVNGGPVSYYDAPAEPAAGHAWGNGQAVDARECDIGGRDCQGKMSKRYARVFAREEDGRLACPECLPRSARYTADPSAGPGTRMDPSLTTGSDNPRSHANDSARKRSSS